MNWINSYMFGVNYLDGGRGPFDYDCWGLVREARHKHQGKRLLPSFGWIRNTMAEEFTKAGEEAAKLMLECEPEDGAVAAVYRGRRCIHAALVVAIPGGGLHVLELNPHKGVTLKSVVEFEAQYLKVIYYRDNPSICL